MKPWIQQGPRCCRLLFPLFFLCLTATGALFSNFLLEKYQEEFVMQLDLPDHVDADAQAQFLAFAGSQEWVRDTHFINKNEAEKKPHAPAVD